ncbi:MAG: hypothetical protein ACI4JY_02515 [Oscillospiraceae bacterium]
MKKTTPIILALALILSLTGCSENNNTNSTADSTNSSPQTLSQENFNSEAQDEPADTLNEFCIPEGPISDLGLTVEQLAEKRGALKVSTYKGTLFENGLGIYGWRTENSSSLTVGGCNSIDGLKPTDLFKGISYPVSYDILSSRYGLVQRSIEKEASIDGLYVSIFSHPKYETVEFVFFAKEFGFIDEETSVWLRLNVDSLYAEPLDH